MASLLIYPDPPPPELAQALDFAGHNWNATADVTSASDPDFTADIDATIVCANGDPKAAYDFLAAIRAPEVSLEPVLLLLSGAQLGEITNRSSLFETFCLAPFHPQELEARLHHLLSRAGVGGGDDTVIEYGPLKLNTETYQAVVSGTPLDLTYMEYELLRFFAQSPGKVFTREHLLNAVWGYDYYGGARTVDVHVRRLRAKLGDEHTGLIQTVRSVGYKFGESRWAS